MFALVIAHCREEPGREGEVALVAAPCLLGQGGPRKDDPLPRAALLRQRPGGNEARSPLRSDRPLRRLLALDPREDGLSVRAQGRVGLRLNGTPVASADAVPGDVLALDDDLVLLVVRRPALLAEGAGGSEAPSFGEADAAGFVGESVAAWDLREQLGAAALARGPVLLHAPSAAEEVNAARALHLLFAPPGSEGSSRLSVKSAAALAGGLAAAPGTLLLDELETLSFAQQDALAAALAQRGQARLLLATSADPLELSPALRDCFSCLVEVPPLDARREDVPLLLRHHARRLAEPGAPASVPGARLVEALLRHPLEQGERWLETVAARSHDGSRPGTLELTPPVEALLAGAERSPLPLWTGEEDVAAAVARAGGNLTKAARMLGLRHRYALSHLLRDRGALPARL